MSGSNMMVVQNKWKSWTLAPKDDPENGQLYFDTEIEAEAALAGYEFCLSRNLGGDW